ncbi:cytochrome P450 family protein [Nocardiopsis salina]|uniref:cytochrome P450 family protein n=1 Tax=Nocardiopsis salina TaxID=245836 RepID=UPI00034B590F|nr:cytochrome P450 [Nocardiopsis salina]
MVADLEVWALTGDDALRSALNDPRFRRNWRSWRALNEGEVPENHPVSAMVHLDNMLTSDGAEHRRLRGLISRAFTPRRIESLRPTVEETARGLIEGLAERAGGGPVDVKEELAYPLSIAVFAALFGFGPAHHDRMRAMVATAFAGGSPEEVAQMRADVDAFLDELVAAKRADPGDDMTSALVAANEDGERLSDVELRDTLWLMVSAGFETTASALANGVQVLLSHPEQLALLHKGEAEWSAAVEEVLRHSTSVATLPFLFAGEDIEIGGVTVEKGEPLLLGYLAANLDEERYGDSAGRFDLTEDRPRHLGLGHGPHTCLGSALARMELETALRGFFTRFPEAAVEGGEPAELPSVFINSPMALPVRLGEPAS